MKNSLYIRNKIQDYKILIAIIALIFSYSCSQAASYTWTGATDTIWAKASNWGSSNYPHAGDNATIVSATNMPVLAANDTVTNFTMTSGTLNLKGFKLVINGVASFTSGTIFNGVVKTNGAQSFYTGTTFSCQVIGVAGRHYIKGATFNDTCSFEQTVATSTYGDGGSTFNKKVTFVKNSSSNGSYWSISNTTANTFNADAVFINNSNLNFYIAEDGYNNFNGNLILGSTAAGGIDIGSSGGGATALNGGAIMSIDAGGFSNGTLLFRNFSCSTGTSQALTLTSSAIVNMISNTFYDDIAFTAPAVLIKSNVFFGTTSLTHTGSTGATSYGGNTFGRVTYISNTGSSTLRFANNANDEYAGDVTFTSNSSNLQPAYNYTAIFTHNLIHGGGNVDFNTGTGRVEFSDVLDQTISATSVRSFNDFKIDKSAGTLTLDTSINIGGTLTLTNGKIISTATHLLIMLNGSTVSGASNNSFVDGPVKKIGNGIFVFPTGKLGQYSPIEITAPSSTSDAYTAEAFNSEQELGPDLDTILTAISYCNYWTLNRNSGSSSIYFTLYWDTSRCAIFDTTNMRIAYWNSGTSKWNDKGHGTITGNSLNGKMKIPSTISSGGSFTLATNASYQISCSTPTPAITFNLGANNKASYILANIGAPYVSGNVFTTNGLINGPLLIQGTFTIDQNFEFKNCNIKMDQNAKIIINSSCTLKITSQTQMYACSGNMWDYIKIDGNGAVLIVKNSTIRDAENAVWSHSGGVYTISNFSVFNKNYKNIVVDSYTNHTGTIINTGIRCVVPGSGSVTTLLLPPHNTVRTHSGIEVTDVTSITIGTSANTTNDNSFFNMDRGIDATNTTLNVYNCNFKQMDGGSGYGINSQVTNASNYTLTVGNSSSNLCDFFNCDYGVAATSMNCNISYNAFDKMNKAAVSLNSNGNKTIDVNHNNVAEFKKWGVLVKDCPNAVVNINFNDLNYHTNAYLPVDLSYYGEVGIEASNLGSSPSTIYITNNKIANTRKGIFARNIYSTSMTNFVISVNEIFHQISYTNTFLIGANYRHYGIQIDNCKNNLTTANSILRQNISTVTQPINGNEWDRIFGIQCTNFDNSLVRKNVLEYISSGVNFRNYCNSSFIVCETFTECFRGADLGYIDAFGNGPIVVMNSQTTAPEGTDDKWLASSGNAAYINRLYGKTMGDVVWYHNLGSGAGPTSSGYPDNTNTFGTVAIASTIYLFDCLYAIIGFSRDSLLGAIVWDTLVYPDHALQRRYAQLSYAYSELDEDTATRLHLHDGKDSMYIAFYDTMAHSNIGKFHTIEKLMAAGNFADAADSLALIVDTNDIEANRIAVLDIYLNTLVPGDALDETQTDDLTAIANECALVGGTAVFEARAILSIDVHDSCTDGGSRMGFAQHSILPGKSFGSYFNLKPNPAHDVVNVVYSLNNEQPATLQITDVTSRVVKVANLSSQDHLLNLDVSALPQGLYIYCLKNNNSIIKTGKFVIE